MDKAIQEFVDCKRIAVVGVSRSERKFGSAAYKELRQRGYDVVPVHPEMASFQGDRCYPALGAIQQRVEGLLVVVAPERVGEVLREATMAGISKVWLQQGAESDEALALAEALGMSVVSKRCILMYAPPVTGFHSVHRFFARLFGQL